VPELIIAPAARQDVLDQAEYYRDQGTPDTAERWLLRTRQTFEYVAAHPGMGEEVRPGLRAWRVERFGQHVVIYQATPDQVEIVRVIHGAADFDAALSP
jgi:plasmid stabilization system protein ParE